MDKKGFTASNFIPERLLDIICILESEEKHHSYKIIRNKKTFFSHRQIWRQERRNDAIEEQCFRSENSTLSGQEKSFFRRQAV